mmetsp:Transcript_27494/g.27715  ORF Transcript_27494/g.27715 Transcript_27494/m.27715 type:complete len:124 (-) Transcript_27494:239-610(-)
MLLSQLLVAVGLAAISLSADAFGNSRFKGIQLFYTHTRLRAGKPVDVTFEGTGKSIVAAQGDLLETVAKKAGVYIPFKCKQGRCGSCEVRLNGRVTAKVCQKATVPQGPAKKLSVVVINKKPL